MKRFFLATVLCCTASSLTLAQTPPPAIGIPPFSSIENGGFDLINRYNLNAHSSIPIVSVPGRGMDYGFAITYDSLIWMKNGSYWSPMVDENGYPTWGWRTAGSNGKVSYVYNAFMCDPQDPWEPFGSGATHSDFRYTDAGGTQHLFPDIYIVVTDDGCDLGPSQTTGYASDGSGIFLDGNTHEVTFTSGVEVTSEKRKDTNGNFISVVVVSSTEVHWKDTTGRIALKIKKLTNCFDGQTTYPDCIEYKYPDSGGTERTTKLYLKAYHIKTNFGCAGMINYDVNGWKLPHRLDLPNGRSYSFEYEPTPGDGTKTTGRVRKVTLPTGGWYQYEYPDPNNGINCADGTVKNLTRKIYENSSTFTEWKFTRTQVGSDWKTVVRAPKLFYDTVENERVFTFSSSGQEKSQKIYQGLESGGALKRTINTTWSGIAPASRTVILEDVSPTIQSKIETVYDSYGNLKELKEYDYGQSTLTRKTIWNYKHETDNNYLSRNIVDRVSSIRVEDSAGNKKSETLINYDEGSRTQTSGAAQHDYTNFPYTFAYRGNPTKVRRWKTGSTYADTVMTYDDLGNVRTIVDPGSHTTTLSYTDSWYGSGSACSLTGTALAYPTQITNAASQNTQMTYYPCTGALRESKDPNDIGASRAGTILSFDLLGRVTQTLLADGGQTDITYNDSNRTITTTTKRTSSQSISVVDNFSTLGLLTQRDLPASRKIVITYDELLREWKVTNPHVSTGDATYGLVETRFDALGRIKLVKNQDENDSAIEYKGNATKLQDESTKQRLLVTDAFGRLTKVCEVTAGNTRSPNENCNISGFTASGYPTTFQYNLLDKLTQIQQGPSGQQQTRTLSYDNLGRQTAARILEVSTGADVTYNYNDDGDTLASVTDPRGTVSFAYDVLHRLTSKNYSTTAANPDVAYSYDESNPWGGSVTNYIGRLTSEWAYSAGGGLQASQKFSYDAVGRVLFNGQCTPVNCAGAGYYVFYAYDLMGNLTQMTYPSGRVVQYAYKTGTGELDKVTDATGTPFDYVSSTTYSNLGPPQALNLANAVSTTLQWTKRGLVDSIVTAKSGGPTHLNLDYTYYANGQIFEIINGLNSLKSEKFTYDDLLRLATAQRGPDASIQRKYSYDYDRFGNRWAQTIVAGSGLGGTNTFNYGDNRVTSTGFTYDGSGNITGNGSISSLSYTQESSLTSVGASISYVYDAQRRRVQKTVSGAVIEYVYSGSVLLAEKTGSTWTDYIFFGGERLAKQTGSSLSTATFLHTDHLGSSRVCTNSSGSSVGFCDYEPFGEIQPGTTCSVPANFRFAGMEWDSETGLYHTWFRQYDVNQGRWMSVDPLAGSGQNPQSLDRYAYVLSDPVNKFDPFGLHDCPPGYTHATMTEQDGTVVHECIQNVSTSIGVNELLAWLISMSGGGGLSGGTPAPLLGGTEGSVGGGSDPSTPPSESRLQCAGRNASYFTVASIIGQEHNPVAQFFLGSTFGPVALFLSQPSLSSGSQAAGAVGQEILMQTDQDIKVVAAVAGTRVGPNIQTLTTTVTGPRFGATPVGGTLTGAAGGVLRTIGRLPVLGFDATVFTLSLALCGDDSN